MPDEAGPHTIPNPSPYRHTARLRTYLEVPDEVDADVLLAMREVRDPARHLLRVPRPVVSLEGGDEALLPQVAGDLVVVGD